MEEQVSKKYFSLRSEIDKSSDMKKRMLLFFDQSVLCENSKFARVIRGVNFSPLKYECAKCMQRSTLEQMDFSAEFASY